MDIIIYNPKNEITNNYRYYNIFFDMLIESLKTKFNVIECRDFKDAHRSRMPITLSSGENISILECELVIENSNTQELYILSVADFFTDANFFMLKNPKIKPFVKKILLSQYNKKKLIKNFVNIDNINNLDKIYSPWIYFPYCDYNFDSLYKKRLLIDNKIDKLYFRGTGLEHRPIINLLNKEIFYGGGPLQSFEKYVDELINYKIGLSLAGTSQFCYRDIEYMAIGIPFLRFEYSNEMNPPIIPNYHYISTGKRLEPYEEHAATKDHSLLVEQRFSEIYNDIEFLNYISANAKNYYETYLKDPNCVSHTLNLLEL